MPTRHPDRDTLFAALTRGACAVGAQHPAMAVAAGDKSVYFGTHAAAQGVLARNAAVAVERRRSCIGTREQ